jgi:hypothetical protein
MEAFLIALECVINCDENYYKIMAITALLLYTVAYQGH